MSFPEKDARAEALRLAGRLIVENGGEIFRVEETISRMAAGFGLEDCECFAVPSGVFFSFHDPETGKSETAVMRVHTGNTNLYRVDEVNSISREVAARNISAEEALFRLKKIENQKPLYSLWQITLGVGVTSAGFTLMFGGKAIDFLIAFLVSIVGWQLVVSWGKTRGLVTALMNSFLVTFIVLIISKVFMTGNQSAIIPGTLMPLVPGLAMTSAVQDSVRGDTVSGISHGLQAVLTAVVIAVGTLIASTVFNLIFGR